MVIALGHPFPIDLCLGLIYKGDRVTTLRGQCHLKEKFNVTVPLELEAWHVTQDPWRCGAG